MPSSAGATLLTLWLTAAGCAGAGEVGEPGVLDAGSPSLYPQVQAILTRSCAISRCHAGQFVGAGLYLMPDGDYRAALVGVTSCEYERLALIEPGRPEKSWVMVKLTAPFRPADDPYANYILFDPEPGWNADARRCRDATQSGEPLFGQRMPATAPNQLPDAELELIAEWIAQGAPP